LLLADDGTSLNAGQWLKVRGVITSHSYLLPPNSYILRAGQSLPPTSYLLPPTSYIFTERASGSRCVA